MAGGHGYGDDGGELRSVVCAGGKQRRERGPGEEREGWTAPGGCVASPRMDRLEGGGLQREAGGGRRRRAPRLASAYWQRKKRTRGGGKEVGWATQVGCTGEAGPAQVSARYFFSFLFIYCFLFLFCLF